jgi:hypothetical protein
MRGRGERDGVGVGGLRATVELQSRHIIARNQHDTYFKNAVYYKK